MAEYHLSSQMLSFLLPPSDGPEETVPVPAPDGKALPLESGVLARSALLAQARAARTAIEKHQPDRVLTIGGDCLVDLAPIAYLNKRHGGNLGVLWIDAHPDVLTPKDFYQGNTHVLAALLGEGDPDFVKEVDVPVRPERVMYAGLDEWSKVEADTLKRLGLRRTGSQELAISSDPVLDWIAETGITHLAVHLDVDVISPSKFRPVLFNKPDAGAEFLEGVPRGHMVPEHVIRLLSDVSAASQIVGLAITEYMSWDAVQTRRLLKQLPLIGE